MNKSARQILKQKLVAGGCLAAPGVYDGLSARIADPMNFDVLYLSGYGVSASLLAKPDAGFLTAENMVMRLTSLCEFLQTPLIADADTGFGGIAETQATVRAYEKAGAAGIQLANWGLIWSSIRSLPWPPPAPLCSKPINKSGR